MTATQRYELIRPIIHKEKTVQQVHEENDISIRTLRRYLKRFREGDEKIESLADKSHAAHSHPKWFTCEQKALVVAYKLENPPISAQQISQMIDSPMSYAISLLRTIGSRLNRLSVNS